MKTKTIKLFLFLLIGLLVVSGIYIVLRNLPFYEIKEVEVSFSDNVISNTEDVQKTINPLKGLNLFEVSVSSVKRKIEESPFVYSAEVKRFFPSKIEIQVSYKEMKAAFFSNTDKKTSYYLADSHGFYQCSRKNAEVYKDLSFVQISEPYAGLIEKFGPDNGFSQMLNLVSGLSFLSQISGIKYNDGSNGEFGRLDIYCGKDKLRVFEPVEKERLIESLEIVRKESDSADKIYDLYAMTLIKRSQEETSGI